MAADWSLIKSEYISDPGASQRKLAEKYGVPYITLRRKCKDEGWVELRALKERKVSAKLVDRCAQKEVSQAEKIIKATDEIADRLINAMATMDVSNANAVRQMTLALKDLREIYNINKTELDKQEQEARIKKLQHDSEDIDQKDNDLVISFEGGEESWRQ